MDDAPQFLRALPEEDVYRFDRAVSREALNVQSEPDMESRVVLVAYLSFNKQKGCVEVTTRIKIHSGDQSYSLPKPMEDGQLVMDIDEDETEPTRSLFAPEEKKTLVLVGERS